ncbi:MAG: PAS domain S-box protein [Methanoregula sp.]|jgi:PAS domain S-box-containing protein|uniref:response regulator n=1 Tax=Methanoregula sp. TaxID=2052170 RepID=UPI003C72B9C5
MYHVLYVDDEPNLLDVAKVFLEATGEFSIDTKLSAQEGLDALRDRVYDAVVSDFQMPGMDGIGFLKVVRAGFGSIPFILFTGRGREEVVIDAINNGTDFYIQKGGDPRAQFAELAHKIRQAVARRTAERSRIESEKRLSDIINFLPDATFAIDKAGTVIAWNHALEEMTGIAASDMMGKGNYEYAVPFYGDPRSMLIDRVFSPPGDLSTGYSHIVRDGTMLAAETVLPHLRGEPRTLWGKASPLYDQNGQISGSIESIRDITERKKAEEIVAEQYRLLAESEFRLKRAEVVAHVGHWEYHLDAGIMTASENAAAIYGVKEIEMPIIAVQKIPLPEYRRAMDDALYALIRSGEPYDLDFRIRQPSDGTLRDIHSIATYDSKKRVVFGIIHDITERKQTEIELEAANEQLTAAEEELRGQYDSLAANQKELAASEEKYRAILENIQDVFYRTDTHGTLVMISPSGAGLLGYADAGEMIGRLATEYYADPAQREDLLAALKKGGAVFNRETLLKRKDGALITVSTSSHAYYDANGNYAGVEGIFRDITESKNTEGELQAAYEQITAAEEELRGQYNELARSERQLRENEENFQGMVESAPDALYISVAEHFVYVNPAMVRLMGATSADQLLGTSLFDRIDPKYHAEVYERARIVVKEHKPVGLEEIVYLMMDGTPVPVESTVALIWYNNKPGGLVILRDITKRREAEEALKESEKRYRDLFEINNTVMFIVDPETGRLVDANAAASRYYGYSREEFAGLNITEINIQDPDVTLKDMAHARVDEGAVFQFRHRKKSGEIRDVEVFSAPITQEGHRYLHSIIQDVTERRRAQEALKASEQKFRDIFNNSTDAIYLHEILKNGTPGRFTDVNDVACRMLGYTKEELLEKSPLDIAPEYHNPPLEKIFEDQRTRGMVSFETGHMTKDGTIIPVEVNTHVVTIQGKNVILAVVRDVRARKKAEEAIRLVNKKLNLLSGITRHDIKNQLTALLQYIDLSKMTVQDPDLKKIIDKEEVVAHNIQRQIEFTKEYEDLGVSTPSWQNVKKCIDLGIKGLDLSGTELNVTGLPDNIEIIADPLLQKVFFNLVDNALRYGGKAMKTIRLSSHKSGNGLVIVCEDDGAGIPVHEKVLIFERGYGKNTGFGLFLIREILATTGITIKETGETGKGARFEMVVPDGGYRLT